MCFAQVERCKEQGGSRSDEGQGEGLIARDTRTRTNKRSSIHFIRITLVLLYL